MNNPTRPTPLARGRSRRLERTSPLAARPASQRGSAIILVVVALVVMLLLSIAYLQSARVQRFASIQNEGDIDTQIDAIVAQVQQILQSDLTDPGSTGATVNELELYDYPRTNQTADWTVEDYNGASQTAKGNDRDDVWLAAQEPNFGSSVWPHVSNPNGIFLNFDNTANTFTLASGIPEEHIVNFSDADHSDTGLALGSTQLVDADGDGIPDSRWTWAPIKTINGVTYVMAIRIVDLSGMANANVALSVIDSSGVYDTTATGTDAPRWSSPSELDLGGFVYDTSADRVTHMAELQDLLQHRFNAPSSPPLPLPWDAGSGWDRHDFWLDQGRYTVVNPNAISPGYSRYTLDDEYELRRRNGLNKDPNNGGDTLTIEKATDGMPAFLRRDGVEATYADVDLATNYAGTNGDQQSFFEREPRHQMTTRNGAAIFAAPASGSFDPSITTTAATNYSYKTDLNNASSGDIANTIERVYSQNTPGSLPGGFTGPANFANQFTANIADYADSDNKLTVLNSSGKNFYGMEALPFIAEVYTQRYYTATNAVANATNASTFDITWTADGQAGFAIEVRNPHAKPISLKNVNLVLVGDPSGTPSETSLGTLDSLAGGSVDTYNQANHGTAAGDRQLYPGDALILYKNSTASGGSRNTLTALWDTATDPAIAVNISGNWPANGWTPDTTTTDAGEAAVNVELRATDQAGTALGWAYSKATSRTMPSNYLQPQSSTDYTASPATEGYYQYASIGNGNRINTMLIAASDCKANISPPQTSYEDDANSPPFVALAHIDKATNAGGPADKLNANKNQLVIRDGDFVQVGELAHVAVVAPWDTDADGTPNTVAEVFNNAGAPSTLDGYRLDFSTSASTISTGNDYEVPHAAFLIDQFTTLSPRVDGVDNDGDGTADTDKENMVSGLVNLNTAPQHLLEKILPITNPTMRQEVAARIVSYRDNPASRPTNQRNNSGNGNKGIAFVGELFTDGVFTDATLATSTPPGEDASDTRQLNSTVVDFLSNVDASTGDGITDDREEVAMLAKWLSQVGSTRSDYFAAYVVVRGYDPDAPDTDGDGKIGFEDPDEGIVDAARFIAIFERNADSGKVVVRALLPGADPYMVN